MAAHIASVKNDTVIVQVTAPLEEDQYLIVTAPERLPQQFILVIKHPPRRIADGPNTPESFFTDSDDELGILDRQKHTPKSLSTSSDSNETESDDTAYLGHKTNTTNRSPATNFLRTQSQDSEMVEKTNLIQGSTCNQEVCQFWREQIGVKVYGVSDHALCEALKHWLRRELDELVLKCFIFRLDEFATGQITLSQLGAFVGDGSLLSMIQKLETDRSRVWITPRLSSPPLIVWVDDAPSNNDKEVEFARSLNIEVIQLRSTALFKRWTDENEELLRQCGSASRVRFLTDNVRFEANPCQESALRPSMNMFAGENVVRYLRGRAYRMPVLVYTYRTIEATKYVLNYENAGSTIYRDIVEGYIQALANGWSSDGEWKRFGASKRVA